MYVEHNKVEQKFYYIMLKNMEDFKEIKKRQTGKKYSYIFNVNQVCVYTCGKTMYLIALTVCQYPGGNNFFGIDNEVVNHDQRV